MDRNALIRALRDTAQSASNAIASNVSGPVDLIAAGLRGVGLPIPQNPVGGSQWMAERGLTAPVQQGVAQVIGDTIGLAGPALVANFAPQIAGALNRGAQNLAAPRTLHPETGAIVWHGSPHRFDRFDSSKIGTGEGAQAYGHGLYLAENPKVAQEYQQALGAGRGNTDADTIARLLDSVGGNPAKAAAAARQRAQYANIPGGKEKLESIAQQIESGIDPRGALYKVDLPDEHIAKMLDWDKPLSQQSNQVQAFFSDHPRPPGPDTTLGEWLKPRIAEGSMIEQDLVQAGIPGIRYLDGLSRNSGGQATSNFVVFPGHENILQILERNGQPLGLMGVR
ncbi:MAG: hypothetical protein ACYCXC_00145 [Acidovorax defluvii]